MLLNANFSGGMVQRAKEVQKLCFIVCHSLRDIL